MMGSKGWKCAFQHAGLRSFLYSVIVFPISFHIPEDLSDHAVGSSFFPVAHLMFWSQVGYIIY